MNRLSKPTFTFDELQVFNIKYVRAMPLARYGMLKYQTDITFSIRRFRMIAGFIVQLKATRMEPAGIYAKCTLQLHRPRPAKYQAHVGL